MSSPLPPPTAGSAAISMENGPPIAIEIAWGSPARHDQTMHPLTASDAGARRRTLEAS
ncbi:hypothetical protein A8926_1272 [Saccharopolyspora spinosa]|uniref:Uncharacterized protein n=1 Tax=Saccharopolyspora spinosa TaxID=60894 RepID=A0A2N3XST8_SACSN|nr:hypothetical protein A8926_1272 [Saccharopolyspora spinosa]